jgi:hypothetical protein
VPGNLNISTPRIVISGTHSGAGKTTVVLGLCSAFPRLGIGARKVVGCLRRHCDPRTICQRSKPRMPVAECIFQRSIENVDADFEKGLYSMPVPSHLLAFVHTLRDNLVDRRFSKPGRYSGSTTETLGVVWHRIRVHFEVPDGVQQCIPQLCQYRDVVKATSSRPMPEVAPGRSVPVSPDRSRSATSPVRVDAGHGRESSHPTDR